MSNQTKNALRILYSSLDTETQRLNELKNNLTIEEKYNVAKTINRIESDLLNIQDTVLRYLDDITNTNKKTDLID